MTELKETVLHMNWLEITIFQYWNFRMKNALLENMAGCTGSI